MVMTNMYFQCCSFFYMIMILILFFSSNRINNIETKTFKYLSIVNIIGIVLDIIIVYLSYVVPGNFSLYILNKFYLLYISLWTFLFFKYMLEITISNKENKKKILLFSTIVLIITAIIIFILPIYLYNIDNVMYTYGPSVTGVYISEAIYVCSIIILILTNYKKMINNKKKYIPLIVLALLCLLALVVRRINPGILLTTTIITYINILMYHTIENPDMKMLREIQQSKEFAEQANNEKAMFLYNMSQEIKTPVKAIEQRCEELLKEQDINEIIDGIKDIKFASKKLTTTINGTLDMSRTQASNIEIKVSKYNIKTLLQEMVSITKINMKDKNLEFRTDFDDAIPEYLMGDSIRLKQIIMAIINNAIKHTEKGFIEFNVSSVIKHDVCRLIITIEDSGKGIESRKLETLFYNTDDEDIEDEDRITKVNDTRESLSVVKILTNLIGGTVIVNSELGKGSKFTVVLDQQIAEEKKTNTMIAIEKLSSNKKVLVVDDEEESIKQIVKVLNKYDINVDTVMWGQECLEKIRKKQKYDLILLDEDMPKLNGIKTFEKLKIEDNFNIPVVIMIDSKHIDYKERYLYNGFSSCIVKPIKKQEVDKILKKYLKLDD